MGHERVGLLPKTEKWRKVVSDIALTATGERATEEIVQQVAKAIDSRFRRLHLDAGVQEAFTLILAVSVAARSESPSDRLAALGFDLQGNDPTPLRLTQALSSLVRQGEGSLEYAELARTAAGRALSEFFIQEGRQRDLLESREDAFGIWRRASDSAGFCVLARQYFSHLTAAYIGYFVEREASAVLPSINARESLQANLDAHVDRVTRHSFETSKIAQSFAAGWYAKNASESVPSRRKTTSFLRLVFNKIRDSLAREEVG